MIFWVPIVNIFRLKSELAREGLRRNPAEALTKF